MGYLENVYLAVKKWESNHFPSRLKKKHYYGILCLTLLKRRNESTLLRGSRRWFGVGVQHTHYQPHNERRKKVVYQPRICLAVQLLNHVHRTAKAQQESIPLFRCSLSQQGTSNQAHISSIPTTDCVTHLEKIAAGRLRDSFAHQLKFYPACSLERN